MKKAFHGFFLLLIVYLKYNLPEKKNQFASIFLGHIYYPK